MVEKFVGNNGMQQKEKQTNKQTNKTKQKVSPVQRLLTEHVDVTN